MWNEIRIPVSTSLTPWMPALSSMPRFGQPAVEAAPVTFGVIPLMGCPPESQRWSSMPGVVSLPIWTMSGRAPPAMRAVIELFT